MLLYISSHQQREAICNAVATCFTLVSKGKEGGCHRKKPELQIRRVQEITLCLSSHVPFGKFFLLSGDATAADFGTAESNNAGTSSSLLRIKQVDVDSQARS
jgi:hypothetical protein